MISATSEDDASDSMDESIGFEFQEADSRCTLPSRRMVLRGSLSLASALVASTARAADDEPNLECLLDLPPLDRDNYVRLYVCRHGQTENNRLGKIQGARVDPSLNETGEQQAARLGQALMRVLPEPPEAVFHSPLTRARETAHIASSAFPSSTLKTLPALAEVDFGPALEGQSADEFRTQMRGTYVEWAMGDINCRMEGGESGRDVSTCGVVC